MKRIRLEKFYQNTTGLKLVAGEHDLEPAIAAYLVDNGHAEYVAAQNVTVTDVTPETLDEMTMKELQAYADEINIKGVDLNKQKKPAMIQTILDNS